MKKYILVIVLVFMLINTTYATYEHKTIKKTSSNISCPVELDPENKTPIRITIWDYNNGLSRVLQIFYEKRDFYDPKSYDVIITIKRSNGVVYNYKDELHKSKIQAPYFDYSINLDEDDYEVTFTYKEIK